MASVWFTAKRVKIAYGVQNGKEEQKKRDFHDMIE